MSRLTKSGTVSQKDINKLLEPSNENQFGVNDAYYKLKEYEDLEEKGMLLKLPYPLGTKKLYLIDGYEIDEIDATGITLYKANENAIRPHETVICVDYCDFYYDDFGKTVFLTKEEAEKALERLENEQCKE